MKKIIRNGWILWLVLLMVIPTNYLIMDAATLPTPDTGVFYNGSLEQVEANGQFTNWFTYNTTTFLVSNTENHTPSGSKSLKVDPSGSAWQILAYRSTNEQSAIPVVQNAVYRISFWHKGANNGQLQVSDFGIPEGIIPVNTDADWTYYSKDYHVGTRGTLTPIEFKNNRSNATGPSYFDDFMIEMISPPPVIDNSPPKPLGPLQVLSGKTGEMQIGTNFWFHVTWSGQTAIKENINWATAYTSGVDIWNPTFIAELEPYVDLRFMDWGGTNNSEIVQWSERMLPTDPENYFIETSKAGMSYEWMIDLCNRTGKDMWVCVPHQANDDYVTQLAQLIKSKLNPSLKCYLEYSNEVWNGGFQQYDYAENKGIDLGFDTNANARYYVYRSLQIFELFKNVYQNDMATKIVKVCSFSGNFWSFDTGYTYVIDHPTYNPNHQKPDMFAVAPYVGSGLDGYASDVIEKFHKEVDRMEYAYVIPAATIAKKHGVALGTYEGGQHILTGAIAFAQNQLTYPEYIYMLNKFSPYFVLFNHYAHCGGWSSSAWGAIDHTGQSVADAPKYRALVDWSKAPIHPLPTPPILAESQLENASFQDGLNHWDAYMYDPTTYEVITSATGRKHYLKFTNPGGINGGGYFVSYCKLTPNTAYTMYYDSLGATSTGGQQLTDVDVLDKAIGIEIGNKNWSTYVWSTNIIDFTTPANGEVGVRIRVPNPNSTVYFDNIKFVLRGGTVPAIDPVVHTNDTTPVTPPSAPPSTPPATPPAAPPVILPVLPPVPTPIAPPEPPVATASLAPASLDGRIHYQDPYMKGYPDQTFRGNQPVTRIEVAAIFAKILQANIQVAPKQMFKDVQTTHWGAGALEVMVGAKLMSGYKDNRFMPNQPITRAELASLIAKYWESAGYKIVTTKAPFTDTQTHWAAAAIAQVYQEKIMTGFPNGTFQPNSPVLREQMAVIMNRLLNRSNSLVVESGFKDLNPSHWAFSAIQAATR